MIRKILLTLSLAVGSVAALSTPAQAGGWHTHYCSCGDKIGKAMCGTTSSSGGTTSGGTTSSGGTTTTSGGTTTTSGGTAVPEPGMLGMMGMGLLGLAYARRRKSRNR